MKNKTLFIRAAILTWLLGFTGACHAGPAGADPALPIIKEEGIYSLEIYPREHRLIVKIQGHKYKTYPVAVGNPSTPTPVGEYLVTYKGKNWGPAFGRGGSGLTFLGDTMESMARTAPTPSAATSAMAVSGCAIET
ncbi:hypothetical protein HMSSN036_10990 [Paenibacillus macerans]|nr:hypothetical protein HMSSN036_10990 [Paenibacillus macerans]